MFSRFKSQIKNLLDRKSLMMLVIVFSVLFFCGISVAYAFYSTNLSFPILANKVGDFDIKGDISAVVYQQINDYGENPIYRHAYGIPTIGYTMDHVDCSIPCTDRQSDDCYYSYDIEKNIMSITSNQKVSCKFYFNKNTESDVNVYVMIENKSGNNTYNGKNYTEFESVPAYGYEYNNYYCVNSSSVVYDSKLKTFKISAKSKDTCYVYFDKTTTADIDVNVFVQSEVGSNIYQEVDSIPINKAFVKSSNPNYVSACYDMNGVRTNDEITYSGGYVTVTTNEKKTCNIYLDIYDGAPLIDSVTATATSNSLTTTVNAIPGKVDIGCYAYKINGVTELSSCQTDPTYTFTNLNSCTYYQVLVNVVDANGIEVGYVKSFKTEC